MTFIQESSENYFVNWETCKLLSKSQSISSVCWPVSFMLERRGLYFAVLLFKSLWVGDRGVSFLAFRRGLHWSAVG